MFIAIIMGIITDADITAEKINMAAEETGVNAAGLDDKDAAAKRNSFAGASFFVFFLLSCIQIFYIFYRYIHPGRIFDYTEINVVFKTGFFKESLLRYEKPHRIFFCHGFVRQ